MRNTFIFYSSFRETANKLNKEDRADFYEAIIEYSLTGIVPELTGIVDIVFTAIKTTIDNQLNNYENGKKGGRPKKENLTNENEKEGFKNENNPPFENEKSYKEKEKDKYIDKYKEKEKEEDVHTPDFIYEENKSEIKSEINPELKKLIGSEARSTNKVTEIIHFYRDNISNKFEDIQEQTSYNQILIREYDMDKMLIGLKNYKRYLESSKKTPCKLFFFIRDGIYNDYQVENAVTIGKNSVIVPADLVGKIFVVEEEKIKFLDDGYLKIDKDHKVTNAKNVEEMVSLVRGVA